MLNEVIKGVSMALGTAFEGRYIYQNDVKQGLEPPCFFIGVLKPELNPLLGRRFNSVNPLDVRFTPLDPANNAEMLDVAGELLEVLEFITLPNGDQVHGTGMNYEIVDGVLHFFVNYNFTVIRPVEQTPMETLETDVGLQKG